MRELLKGLTDLGFVIWQQIKAQRADDEIKREASEKLMVAIDNAIAKRRLKERKTE